MTPQELFDLLDSLGGSADIIAARLESEGYVGMPCFSSTCPIAKFVGAECRKLGLPVHGVVVGPAATTVHVNSGKRSITTNNPPAVTAFVNAFDKEGKYPALRLGW